MANQAELKLILNAVDNASAKINGVTGSVDKLGKISRIGGDFVSGLGANFSAMINPAMLAGQAVYKMAEIAKKSIGDWVAYNQQIREMGQVTGLGAEEISRIVQVADDWMIDINEVRTSLAFMNKTGVTPSIEELAKLADEYVNTDNKAAFAEKAVKLLGRGYQTLIPLLANGGDALRNQAAAIDDNLLATEDSVATTLEFQQSVDALKDSATGLGNTLAKELLPPIIDVTNALNDLISTAFSDQEAIDQLNAAEKAGIITRKDVIRIMQSVAKDTMTYADAIVWLTDKTRANIPTETAENKLLLARQSSVIKNTDATEDLGVAAINTGRGMRILKGALEDTTQAELAQKEATEKINHAMGDLNTTINNQLGPELEDFLKGQSDLEQQMLDVQTAIDKAIADGYDPLSETVLGLKGDYEELKGQYGENEKEHDRASKEIMFDLLEQEMALGGYTNAERIALEAIAKDWGLPYQATVDYMKKQEEAITWLADHPGDVAGFLAIMNGQKTAWDLTRDAAIEAASQVLIYGANLLAINGRTVDTFINTHYVDYTERGPGRGVTGHHAGADFVVPPGYPNDSFPMRVESGERVTVTPAGNTTNNSNSFTMNVHTNAPYSTLMRDYQMMKAMAG